MDAEQRARNVRLVSSQLVVNLESLLLSMNAVCFDDAIQHLDHACDGRHGRHDHLRPAPSGAGLFAFETDMPGWLARSRRKN